MREQPLHVLQEVQAVRVEQQEVRAAEVDQQPEAQQARAAEADRQPEAQQVQAAEADRQPEVQQAREADRKLRTAVDPQRVNPAHPVVAVQDQVALVQEADLIIQVQVRAEVLPRGAEVLHLAAAVADLRVVVAVAIVVVHQVAEEEDSFIFRVISDSDNNC